MRRLHVAERQTWFLIACTILILTACAMPDAEARDQGARQPLIGPPKTLVVCLDVSLSVPASVVPESKSYVAWEYRHQAYPGAGPFFSYFRTIRDNSVDPTNNLLTVAMPGVRKKNLTQPNPLDPAPDQTATAKHNASETARQKHDLQVAQSTVNNAAKRVLSLKVQHDTKQGTDLFSCPAVASVLFSLGGTRQLLVISDLIAFRRQGASISHLHLHGVDVRVIDYCHGDRDQCDKSENYFQSVVKSHGARSFKAFDFTQIPELELLGGAFKA